MKIWINKHISNEDSPFQTFINKTQINWFLHQLFSYTIKIQVSTINLTWRLSGGREGEKKKELKISNTGRMLQNTRVTKLFPQKH